MQHQSSKHSQNLQNGSCHQHRGRENGISVAASGGGGAGGGEQKSGALREKLCEAPFFARSLSGRRKIKVEERGICILRIAAALKTRRLPHVCQADQLAQGSGAELVSSNQDFIGDVLKKNKQTNKKQKCSSHENAAFSRRTSLISLPLITTRGR